MSDVERDGAQFVVDAAVLSNAFGLSAQETRIRLQDGQIKSLCEAGEGEDAGRWRLTFRHQGRAFRLVVDSHGEILSRASFPVSRLKAETRTPVQAKPEYSAWPGREEA